MNTALSEYSDDSIDESASSTASSLWRFGRGKISQPPPQKNSANNKFSRSKSRTSQQILATARAVANDINHPNQEEVIFIYTCMLVIIICLY